MHGRRWRILIFRSSGSGDEIVVGAGGRRTEFDVGFGVIQPRRDTDWREIGWAGGFFAGRTIYML